MTTEFPSEYLFFVFPVAWIAIQFIFFRLCSIYLNRSELKPQASLTNGGDLAVAPVLSN